MSRVELNVVGGGRGILFLPAHPWRKESLMRCLSPARRFYAIAIVLLVLVSGCSRKSRISFSNQGATAFIDSIRVLPPARVSLSWSKQEVFPGRNLVLEKYEREGPFSTAHSGNIHVDFALLNDGVASSTRGSIELPLRHDWAWGVDFWVSDTNPTSMCYGCMGSLEFPLDPALGYDPSMKLYVFWGGNSISDPVVY
jgi:hypothetical protein